MFFFGVLVYFFNVNRIKSGFLMRLIEIIEIIVIFFFLIFCC